MHSCSPEVSCAPGIEYASSDGAASRACGSTTRETAPGCSLAPCEGPAVRLARLVHRAQPARPRLCASHADRDAILSPGAIGFDGIARVERALVLFVELRSRCARSMYALSRAHRWRPCYRGSPRRRSGSARQRRLRWVDGMDEFAYLTAAQAGALVDRIGVGESGRVPFGAPNRLPRSGWDSHQAIPVRLSR